MSGLLKAMYADANLPDLEISSQNYLTRITRINKEDNVEYKLDFVPAASSTKVFTNPSTSTIRTRNLILCLTKKALAEIQFEGFSSIASNLDTALSDNARKFFPAAMRYALGAVDGLPLQKIVLGYKSVWWNEYEHILPERAKIITDISVRQIYFDGRSQILPLIMLYIDGPPLGAWRSFAREDDGDYIPYWNLKTSYTPSLMGRVQVSHRMYRHIKRLIARILQIEPDGIPVPTMAAMTTWDDWPHTAGWHSWKAGHHSTPIRKWLVKPLPNEKNVFGICGEAFSTLQGWMEGAFRSAELLLTSHAMPAKDSLNLNQLTELGLGSVDDYVNY